MEWLGGAAVMSLSRYMVGCGGEGTTQPGPVGVNGAGGFGGGPGDAATGRPAPSQDAAAHEAESGVAPGCETPFGFAPGQAAGGPFDGWGERTVDEQNLAAILTTWTLSVGGLVKTPKVYSFQDLLCLPRQDQVTDFHCVEGWSVYDVPWNGVHLSHLLDASTPLGSATHVAFHGVGGKYIESLPLGVALEPRTILAYGVSGSSLPLAHGFPVRMVIPRLLGYKNAKYVAKIDLVDHEVTGFWSQYGYPYDGEVPPARLRPGKY